MDAGVFATVLFAIAQVRHRLRFQLDTGGGKRNIRGAADPPAYAPNPETPHRCRAHETLLIQLQSENMMI